MNDRPNSGDLSSWKDIAAYLGVTVRTAQKWEIERGLPVRRPPGKRAKVFALTHEIDAWRQTAKPPADDNAAVSGTEAGGSLLVAANRSTLRRHPLYRYGWCFLLILLLIAAAAYWQTGKGPPDSMRIEQNNLVVCDGKGKELWRKDLTQNQNLGSIKAGTPQGRSRILVEDVDDDGEKEILIATQYDRSHNDFVGKLECYSDSSEPEWSFGLERTPASGRGDIFRSNFAIHNFQYADLGPPLGKVLVVVSLNYPDYPCQIALLSPRNGSVLKEYWHSGYIGAWSSEDRSGLLLSDWDGDGKKEIFLAGVNNAYKQATLVVLDPEFMDGASVEANHDYQLLGFAPGREEARVLFPNSCMTESYGDAYEPSLSGSQLFVNVRHRGQKGVIMYALSRAYDVLGVSMSTGYRETHALLRTQRLIDHDLDEAREREEFKKIKVLTPPPDPLK